MGRIWELAKSIYPLNRSISSKDNLKTLNIIKDYIGSLEIKSWKEGDKYNGWEVPKGWNCKNAWIIDENGEKFVDFKDRNLRITSYSIPVKKIFKWNELKKHLHISEKIDKDAYPYTTSYYARNWGFNLTVDEFKKLKGQTCEVFIDSEFLKGWPMYYGELLIPGKYKKEILLTTYICHPSMGNNETSGICVTSEIAKKVNNLSKKLNYSIRILFIPETIGSIFYIRDNLKKLKKNVKAGLVLTCLGDKSNSYSYPLIFKEKGLLEKCFKSLENSGYKFNKYSPEERGSDERNFAWPTVGIDITSISKTKYHVYPEYHSSRDDLNFINENSLLGSVNLIEEFITRISKNTIIKSSTNGEPFLMKINMGINVGGFSHNKDKRNKGRDLINVLWYSNGLNDTFEISKLLKLNFDYIHDLQMICISNKLANLVDAN